MKSNPSFFYRSNRVLSCLRITFAGTLLSAAATMALFAALPGTPSAGTPSAATTRPKNGVYIVQMLAAPAATYKGNIAGYKATAPRKGAKINPLAADTVRYVGYLKRQHDAALRKVGGGAKIYDYTFSYNGFAAKLTAKQAAALAKQPGVLAVRPDKLVTKDTSSTPQFLGLDAPGGLWQQLGGPTGGKKGFGAGEGIVIGVLDTGIWPESKSFSERDAAGKLIYRRLLGFHGECEGAATDGSWTAKLCNRKLVAAQHFNEAWGGDAGIQAERPWEFISPRDYDGHGTHTSSTAGGNNGVSPTGPAAGAGLGPISGMAPRARIAMYKVCWSTEDGSTASCFNSDSVAAIDQAVADGVDVINFSISGSETDFLDPVEVGFLFAADAGVFVSASAGNSGPATNTVAHPGPWLTTVAAGTHNRNGQGSVTLGNGATYNGASIASAVGPAPLILSTDAGLSGADATAVRLCFAAVDNGGTPVLDPAKVAGKIVLCDRGTNARTNKSLAVAEAGGIGMILANTSPNSLNADLHFVPTVHISDVDGAAVKAYVAGTVNPTAKINQATLTFSDPAPFTAAFSSRGPLSAGDGDLLKPDVIAPGQDILAAWAPTVSPVDFNIISGTSMSAPHVAGVAALLKQLHPSWSPMMIKSALMTSGYDVLDSSISEEERIFRQGAGHIQPNSAADPGLVYNSEFNDWLAFLCGTTNGVGASTCNALANAGYSLDPSDLNVPSIAIGDLAGVQTVTRKVTNVGSSAAIYTASTTGLSGLTVNVNPSLLTLNVGETKSYTVTFTRTTAPLNTYVGGQLTWSGGTHTVRIPVIINPVALAAPPSVFSTGADISYTVKFGYDGPFAATGRGLIPATSFPGTVADDPGDDFSPGGPGTVSFDVVVPAGTTYARFSLFNEFTDGNDDLDLYVYRVSTDTLVAVSAGGTTNEEANLVDPPADTYRVWVHGFGTEGPDANFTLFTWVLGTADAGNMTVTAPSTATLGGTGNINLAFSGLAPATKYLGSVAYSGSSDMPDPTIVRVDTP